MSKRFLKLFALVAVFTLTMVGSAFAAAGNVHVWQGLATTPGIGQWGDPSSWVGGQVPTAADLAVFPNTAKEVQINADAVASAIRVDSGADVVFKIAPNKTLTVGNTANTYPTTTTYAFSVEGNVRVEGGGNVVLLQGAGGFVKANTFEFNVVEGATIDFGVVVDATAPVGTIWKYGKGTLAFSAPASNLLDDTTDLHVQDGILSITRATHLNGDSQVYLDFDGVANRVPTLKTLWTNSQSFTTAGKIFATTNGVLDVAGEGSTLVLKTVLGVLDANSKTVTKKGVGTLQLGDNNSIASVWNNGGTLNIAEGDVVVDAEEALEVSAVNVTIGEGTKFTLNKLWLQHVKALSGKGTLQLLEQARLTITDVSTFPGYITGAGNLEINADPVTITGEKNDYTGDTLVMVASRVIINHEKNLGGSKRSRVYLSPLAGPVTNANQATYARLEVADGKSFILPNHLYVGDGAVLGSKRSTGGAVVVVPINTRLEIANDITYNQNFVTKLGEGELYLSSLGYDCVGDGSYEMDGDNSVALQILNGKVRVENAKAAALGDILVDNGGSNANRPILSIRNGLKMSNNIFFTDQATFQTELVDANLSEGTNVQSAVEVGKVFFSVGYLTQPANNATGNGIVYNRVAFDQLSTGTVVKGNDFQLMKAVGYVNYDAPKVEPDAWDGQSKAPFDPYFSTVYLYFKATHNIDVPIIGTATPASVKPSEKFSLVIPVTTTTGMKPGSATVHGLAGASITINGNNLQIAGTAPAAEGNVPYRVSVSSKGDVATDTLEYESYKDFVLQVTSSDVPTPTPTIDEDAALVSAATTNPTNFLEGTAVELFYTLGSAYDLATLSLEGAPAGWTIEPIVGNSNGDVVVRGTMPNSNVSFRIHAKKAASQADAGKEFKSVAYPITYTPKPAPKPDDDSSGGCDAGFAGLALLLAAPLFLRKRD